jgi:hypothetical protein
MSAVALRMPGKVLAQENNRKNPAPRSKRKGRGMPNSYIVLIVVQAVNGLDISDKHLAIALETNETDADMVDMNINSVKYTVRRKDLERAINNV